MEAHEARIEHLTARLAELERRTADETAAIRAELDELRTMRGRPAAAEPRPAGLAPPPARTRPATDVSWLAGPRGLALAGGVVTLLGIVFVFVLASSRGWIDPAVRCSIGGCVSVGLLCAAVVVRRRFGGFAAALAAAGTGVGGCYLTLYAASRGYHLIGAPSVWVGVCVTAAAAGGLALAWRSQVLAVLGLATIVVAPPFVEGRLTALGLGASVVAAAAALGVGQARRWYALGSLSYGLLFVQTAVYVVQSRLGDGFDGFELVPTWRHRTSAVVLAWLVFGLAPAGAAAYQRHRDRLDWFAAALLGASLPLALLSIWRLVDGDDARATVLLVLGAAYGLPAAVLWTRARTRMLAELQGALALVAVALSTATYLSNGGLLVAWTLEGLALTAVAVRVGRRYQGAGLAYFTLAALHALASETPLSHLFTERTNPAQHAGGVVLLAVALAVAAVLLRHRDLLVPRLDLVLAAAAGMLALYLASLGVLEASQSLGAAAVQAKFQRGETLVSSLWALVALCALTAGLLRNIRELRRGGLVLLAVALAKLFLFDLSQLSSLARAGSFLTVGLALLAGGFLVQRLARGSLGAAASRT